MRKTALCSLALVGLLLTSCGSGSAGNSSQSKIAADCSSLQGVFSELLDLTNNAREEVGAPSLRFSFQLGQSAQRYAEDLATQNFFSHKGKDGSTYVSRIKDTGYRSSAVGENLIAGYTTAEQAFEGWMISPSHKENLLHAAFTEVGFGMFDATGTSTYGRYWVQHLGKPSQEASRDERVYIPDSCGSSTQANNSGAGTLQAIAGQDNLEPATPVEQEAVTKSVQTPSAAGALPVNKLAMHVALRSKQDTAKAESIPEPAITVGLAAVGIVIAGSRRAR